MVAPVPRSFSAPPPPPAPPLPPAPLAGNLVPFPGLLPPPPAPGPKTVPAWADPKKPKAAAVVETANKDRERFQGYVAKVHELFRKTDEGYGAIFASEQDTEDLEAFHSPALKIEIDRLCAWAHNHQFIVRAPVTDPLDVDEAADKEDAGYYWLECIARQHAAAGNGDWQWSLFDTLANYGRLATLVTCDFADAESGFTWRMLDPATTFPFFEGKRGLHHVSLVYAATASEILGFYGDEAGKLERKLKRQLESQGTDLGLETEGEVVEWIDRAWHAVYWNGTELKCSRHGYGFVPVRYDRGPGGRQAFTSTSALGELTVHETGSGREQTQYISRGGIGNARLDEARIGLPFQYWKLKSHNQMEANLSNYQRLANWFTDPSWLITQGYESERQGVPEIGLTKGKPYTLREDERAEVPQLPFFPQVLQTVIGQIMQDQLMAGAGPVAFGQNPAAQTTGSAAGILDAEGKEIWAPWLRVGQQHITGLLEMTARLYRDWGELQGAPGSRGSFTIPRKNPRAGQSQAFELTPAILERVGIRFEAELHRFNAQTLAQLAAGIVQLMNVNVLGQEDAMDIVGFHQNTRAAMQRMREEQLASAPEITQADQLRRLQADVERAELKGDEASYREAVGRRDFLARRMVEEEMRNQLMLRSMAMGQAEQQQQMLLGPRAGVPPANQPQMAPPGGQPPSPIPPGGTASLPGFGIQPGQQGGRPQGQPPPGMMGR